MPINKDSIPNTFFVATAVCLVCSLLVSTAAVGLKSMQDRNVSIDRKTNILRVAGFTSDEIKEIGVDELFADRFDVQIIDLDTGEIASEEDLKDCFDYLKIESYDDGLVNYDQFKASKSKVEQCAQKEDKALDIAGIKYRENFSHVYLLMDESGDNIEQYVLPIRGYGLWSTLKGFLSVKPDFQTIVGLTYYEHAETPGLGGEVDNEQWKNKWIDKQIFDPNGDVKIRVVKGKAGDDPYGVDGLSGATITSNGVSNMLKYWLGPDGFGPYINRIKSGSSSASINSTGGSNG